MREVYVISDLHIGGEPAKPTEIRGFQLNTHTRQLADFIETLAAQPEKEIELVINGDLVDFLAESPWSAFEQNVAEAIRKLKRIIRREEAVFTALQNFLCSNRHRLVLLLGNHDIELSLPQLRGILQEAIGATNANFKFIYDGEAYTIGSEVLIEHGNRYDAWNSVDDAKLRLLREMQSRNEMPDSSVFRAPKGSTLVEQIMNPMKEKYRFIDLLKPETGAVIPILLALEPSLRGKIDDLLRIYLSNTIVGRITSRDLSDFSTHKEEEDLVNQELAKVLNNKDLKEFLIATDEGKPNNAQDPDKKDTRERSLSFGFISGVLQLLMGSSRATLQKRLPALLKALQALQTDKTFDTHTETFTEYISAANKLALNGYRYILFGHTHLAKKIQLNNGSWYFNSGTWADLMAFPPEILSSNNKQTALNRLEKFIEEITLTNLPAHIRFNPTCIYLQINNSDKVQTIQLMSYNSQTRSLSPLG